MVTAAQIEKGISVYLDQNLLPLLPAGSAERVLFGAGAAIFLRRNLPKIVSVLGALGAVDENGLVDESIVLEEVQKRIPETGMRIERVPLIKAITLHKSDADEIVRCIREAN